MSGNIENQLIAHVKISLFFALQMDGCLNISNNVNLIVFICYELGGKIYEDFLFNEFLPTHTTSAALRYLDSFIQAKEIN